MRKKNEPNILKKQILNYLNGFKVVWELFATNATIIIFIFLF